MPFPSVLFAATEGTGNSTTAILLRHSLQQGNGSGVVKVTTTCFNVAFFILKPDSDYFARSRLPRFRHVLRPLEESSRALQVLLTVQISTVYTYIVHKSDQTLKSCCSPSINNYLLVRCLHFKRCAEPVVFDGLLEC